jgi:CBS domain-containing protein
MAGEVMTRDVITAFPRPVSEVATLLEDNRITRLPIVEQGHFGNVTHKSARGRAPQEVSIDLSDWNIREKLLSHLKKQLGPSRT